MLSSKSSNTETLLEQMWETHRDYLKRILISLTRDIDLADDLLQETYLRACDGFGGYRGGDAKAWLTAIAKNVFYAHARRKYFSSEVELDSETPAQSDPLGSNRHITLISLRQAIADLSDPLRQALLMKHYGGFTYSEIARQLGCPQGTAQQRVYTAIRKLRETLGALREELAEMTCGELSGKKLVDYVYGKLSPEDMAAVREHLEKCSTCRNEVDETMEVFKALDAVECNYKMVFFMEEWRSYIMITAPVPEEDQQPFEIGPHWQIIYAAIDGDEVMLEELPNENEPERHRYAPHFQRNLKPGEIVEIMLVAEQDRWDTSNEDILTSHGNHSLPVDSVWMIALRLDKDAVIVSTDPEPTELRTNGHTTVYYRRFLPANQEFEWTVRYKNPEIGVSDGQ